MKSLASNLSLGLVHWPIVDRAGNKVATNVTNFDIHDIARVSRTYGLSHYFIINKMEEQLMYVSRVLDHWKVGLGSKLNPMRRTALGMVHPVPTIESAVALLDKKPLVVATAARNLNEKPVLSFRQLRAKIEDQVPVLLLFGTGFGLHEEALMRCDVILEPIKGTSEDDYRHLSVRSAVSICLDRLLGQW